MGRHFKKNPLIKLFIDIFQLSEFVVKFDTEGPGTVEQDMDRGQKLMEIYAQEFEKLDAIRLEMGKNSFFFFHFRFSFSISIYFG